MSFFRRKKKVLVGPPAPVTLKPKKKWKWRWRFHMVWNYLWQPLTAMIYIWVVLFSLDKIKQSSLLWSVGVTVVAASTYLVFIMPDSPSSRWFRILFGYLLAFIIGELLHVAVVFVFGIFPQAAGLQYLHFAEIGAVLGFGLTLYLMLFLRIPHPPAIGFATMLIIQPSGSATLAGASAPAEALSEAASGFTPHLGYVEIIVVAIAIIILVLLKFFLRRQLINLV